MPLHWLAWFGFSSHSFIFFSSCGKSKIQFFERKNIYNGMDCLKWWLILLYCRIFVCIDSNDSIRLQLKNSNHVFCTNVYNVSLREWRSSYELLVSFFFIFFCSYSLLYFYFSVSHFLFFWLPILFSFSLEFFWAIFRTLSFRFSFSFWANGMITHTGDCLRIAHIHKRHQSVTSEMNEYIK